MKSLTACVIGGGLLLIGFVIGSIHQDAKAGYHFKTIDERPYDSSVGKIRLIHATESIGTGFLQPDTTMIVLGDRTIYKAQREFQESSPFVDKIQVNENVIEWDDGISHFSLTLSNKADNATLPHNR